MNSKYAVHGKVGVYYQDDVDTTMLLNMDVYSCNYLYGVSLISGLNRLAIL